MDISLEPLVQVQKTLTPPRGDFWTAPQEAGAPPLFTTREVATVFFARSRVWFNLLLVSDKHQLDDEVIDIPRSPAGYRRFQLHHVELIAHAFFSQGIIDFRAFANCIGIIKCIADNYRLI